MSELIWDEVKFDDAVKTAREYPLQVGEFTCKTLVMGIDVLTERCCRLELQVEHAEKLVVSYGEENITLSAENARLREALENAKDKVQDAIDLARTGSAPDAFGMSSEQWLERKGYKIEGELLRILEVLVQAIR